MASIVQPDTILQEALNFCNIVGMEKIVSTPDSQTPLMKNNQQALNKYFQKQAFSIKNQPKSRRKGKKFEKVKKLLNIHNTIARSPPYVSCKSLLNSNFNTVCKSYVQLPKPPFTQPRQTLKKLSQSLFSNRYENSQQKTQSSASATSQRRFPLSLSFSREKEKQNRPLHHKVATKRRDIIGYKYLQKIYKGSQY